jgi:uncharacterized repeat protein (TIGR03803 family)
VTNALEKGISKMRQGAVSAALTFVVALRLEMFSGESMQAQTFTVLYNFSGSNGAYPHAGLIRDAGGNLYGTTYSGGSFMHGTVFKLNENGTLSVLYSFGKRSQDGAYPSGGLFRDKARNLYVWLVLVAELEATDRHAGKG